MKAFENRRAAYILYVSIGSAERLYLQTKKRRNLNHTNGGFIEI